MKQIITYRTGICLAAISIYAALADTRTALAQTADADSMAVQTLPAVIVTAEWKKPAVMTSRAYMSGSGPAIFGSVPMTDEDPVPPRTREFKMLLKTNVLRDLALMPNVGLEAGLGKGWSIGADITYGWWTDRSKFYWRAFTAGISARRYFGKGVAGTGAATGSDALSGHHIGLYGGIMTYDIELGGRGFICDWREEWGRYAGLEYGYSLPISGKLHADFSVGLGYAEGRYKEYLPVPTNSQGNLHYVWQATEMLHYFGPTRLGISLVLVLEPSRKKTGK